MTKQNKNDLYKILIAFVFFILGWAVNAGGIVRFALFFAAFLIAGLEVLVNAVRNIINGQIFDEEFLMTVATVGAFCVGEYPAGGEGALCGGDRRRTDRR